MISKNELSSKIDQSIEERCIYSSNTKLSGGLQKTVRAETHRCFENFPKPECDRARYHLMSKKYWMNNGEISQIYILLKGFSEKYFANIFSVVLHSAVDCCNG